MNFLFDTNTLAFLYDENAENHAKIYHKFSTLKSSDSLYVSILSLYEMEYSIFNGEPDKQSFFRETFKSLRGDFQVLPLPESGAQIYGQLKAYLKSQRNINRKNIKIHSIDLMLASQAIVEGCILVSGDGIFEGIGKINSKFLFQNWLS